MAQQTPGQHRSSLTPDIEAAWRQFSGQVFTAGALDAKTKQLIAVAVAHVTQCPDCIRGHTDGAQREGASEQELMEAIWVAAEMRAGGAVAHSRRALEASSGGHRLTARDGTRPLSLEMARGAQDSAGRRAHDARLHRPASTSRRSTNRRWWFRASGRADDGGMHPVIEPDLVRSARATWPST